MKNKFSSILIYLILWIAIVVCQILLLQGTSAENPTIFDHPSLYYSTIIVDVYLIVLFYLNYFFLAPFMFKRDLYKEYIFTAVAATIIGFVIPIICYSVFSWSMPNTATGRFPISSLGIVGPVFAISIGLAIRSVLEWAKLSSTDIEMKKTIREQDSKIARLEATIKELESKTKAKEDVVQVDADVVE